MSIEAGNSIKVYGNRNDLIRFKNDLSIDGNSVFSFKKMKPEPDYNRYLSEDGYTGDYIWDVENMYYRCLLCRGLKIIEEKDHLVYTFVTGPIPFEIYDLLIAKYESLYFEIDAWDYMYFCFYTMVASGGKYIKNNYQNWDYVKWNKGGPLNSTEDKYITFEYVEDYLNDGKITITKTHVNKDGKSVPFLEPSRVDDSD